MPASDPVAIALVVEYAVVIGATAWQLRVIFTSRHNHYGLMSGFLAALLVGALDRALLLGMVCGAWAPPPRWSHHVQLVTLMLPACTDFAAYSLLLVFYSRTAFGYARSAAMDHLRRRFSEAQFNRVTAGACAIGNAMLLVGTGLLIGSELAHTRDWYLIEKGALDLAIAALIAVFGALFARCEEHHRWLLPRARPGAINTVNALLVFSHVVDALISIFASVRARPGGGTPHSPPRPISQSAAPRAGTCTRPRLRRARSYTSGSR